MTQIITATVVEGGALRPNEVLNLPDGTRVRLIVQPLDELEAIQRQAQERWSSPECQAAWDELERLMDDSPIDSGGPRLTRDQLHDRD